MTGAIEHNERTAMAQTVSNQPDGPGKRIGRCGELTIIGNVLLGGTKHFRERPGADAIALCLAGQS